MKFNGTHKTYTKRVYENKDWDIQLEKELEAKSVGDLLEYYDQKLEDCLGFLYLKMRENLYVKEDKDEAVSDLTIRLDELQRITYMRERLWEIEEEQEEQEGEHNNDTRRT